MTGSSRSVKSAREILLNHPLSQPSDMRLVSACEILVMEYETLDTIPSPDPTDPRSVTHFSKALEKMHQWEREWMDLLSMFLFYSAFLIMEIYDLFPCFL